MSPTGSNPGFVGTISTSRNGATLKAPTAISLPTTLPTLTPLKASATISAPALHTTLAPAHVHHSYLNDNAVGKPRDKVIVLFRSDLRLDDHPALSYALEDSKSVIPVYCFDPRHFGRTQLGFQRIGKYRTRFLIESVRDLRQSLRNKSSDLIVRVGHPEKILPELCSKLKCDTVFAHKEVTQEEQQVETSLRNSLKDNGHQLTTFWANTLYHEDDLPFPIHRIPDVYSDFRETVKKSGVLRAPLPIPDSLPRLPSSVKPGNIPTLQQLGVEDTKPSNYSTTRSQLSGISAVKGGETEAMLRVQSYVDDTRRFDSALSPKSRHTAHLGADFSCKISPWLALGCVSPRRIFAEMKRVSLNPEKVVESNTYWELVWRDFFRYITAKYAERSQSVKGASRTPQRSMVLS